MNNVGLTKEVFPSMPIGMLAKSYAGSTPPRGIGGMFGGPHPWISSSELNQAEITSTKESITDLAIASSAVKWIEPQSPVMAMYGATAGVVSWVGLRATSNQAVLAFQVDPTKAIPRWLHWSLKYHAPMIVGQCQGSGQPNISKEIVDRFVVQLPHDLDEQRRIAAILDASEAAIRASEAVIEKIIVCRKGLVENLFAQYSAMGVCPLKNIAQVYGGKRLPAGHDYSKSTTRYRYLRVTDFFGKSPRWNELASLGLDTFNALSHYEIRKGHVYISIAGSLGWAGVYDHENGDRVILTENAARIEPDQDKILPWFLAHQINSAQCQAHVHAEKGTGGGVPKLALFRIESMPLVVPPISDQRRVLERIDAANAVIEQEAHQLAKLRLQHQGLLHDLLTGRVRTTAIMGSVA